MCISALNRKSRGELPEKPVIGRHKKVSSGGVTELSKKMTKKALRLQAVKDGEEFDAMVKEQMAEESKNGYGMGNATEISGKTLTRIMKDIKAKKRTAKLKTPARTAAYTDIRSPIALCAVLDTVMQKVDPALFLSSDDVSILVNDNGDPQRVLTTAEAEEILKLTNTSTSLTEAEKKQRVVTFHITISAAGETVCRVIKFADRNFSSVEGMKEKPRIVDVGDNTFVCFYPYGMTDSVVNDSVYRKCVLPCAVALRTRLVQGEHRGLDAAEVKSQPTNTQSPCQSQQHQHSQGHGRASTSSHPIRPATRSQQSSADDNIVPGSAQLSQSSQDGADDAAALLLPPPPPPSPPEPDATSPDESAKRYDWMCLACDGAYGQIDAITNESFNKHLHKHAPRTIFVKYSAGRSLSESPNDLGWMHSILHRSFKAYHFKYGKFKDPPGGVWTGMKAFLGRNIDGSSFSSVWRALCHSKEYLDKAFSKANIKSAFLMAGIEPLDVVTVLSHNPHFRELDKPDAQWVVKNAVPRAAEVCKERGYVPEQDLQQILSERPHIDNSAPRKPKNMALNDMAVNRQRALILSHPEFMAELRSKREKKAVDAAATAEKKAQKAEAARKRKVSETVADSGSSAPGAVAATSAPAKRSKRPSVSVSCANSACGAKGEDGAGDRDGDGDGDAGWKKCSWPYCRAWYCGAKNCVEMAAEHHARCKKRKVEA
jgi:hypothetical protein